VRAGSSIWTFSTAGSTRGIDPHEDPGRVEAPKPRQRTGEWHDGRSIVFHSVVCGHHRGRW
jgi:hypothetical protein